MMTPMLNPMLTDSMVSVTNELWTPKLITTGLWLDGADPLTVTESLGKISQWDDKSGNGRNATQASGAAQPTYIGNLVDFNGSSEFFDMGTGLDFLAGVDHTAFTMLNATNRNNWYGAANGGSGSQSTHIGFRNSGSYRVNYWGNDYYPPITANYVAGELNIVRHVWPIGFSKSVYANAKLEGTGGPAAGSISAMLGGGRLVNVVGQGFLDAGMGEFVIVPGAISQDTIDRVEGYMAWKWNTVSKLPANHPYKQEAPKA